MIIRSISSPKPGWSLPDAVRLARQGHQLQQVQRVTGYAPARVRDHLPGNARTP